MNKFATLVLALTALALLTLLLGAIVALSVSGIQKLIRRITGDHEHGNG